jgi:hypothetical protein
MPLATLVGKLSDTVVVMPGAFNLHSATLSIDVDYQSAPSIAAAPRLVVSLVELDILVIESLEGLVLELSTAIEKGSVLEFIFYGQSCTLELDASISVKFYMAPKFNPFIITSESRIFPCALQLVVKPLVPAVMDSGMFRYLPLLEARPHLCMLQLGAATRPTEGVTNQGHTADFEAISAPNTTATALSTTVDFIKSLEGPALDKVDVHAAVSSASSSVTELRLVSTTPEEDILTMMVSADVPINVAVAMPEGGILTTVPVDRRVVLHVSSPAVFLRDGANSSGVSSPAVFRHDSFQTLTTFNGFSTMSIDVPEEVTAFPDSVSTVMTMFPSDVVDAAGNVFPRLSSGMYDGGITTTLVPIDDFAPDGPSLPLTNGAQGGHRQFTIDHARIPRPRQQRVQSCISDT